MHDSIRRTVKNVNALILALCFALFALPVVDAQKLPFKNYTAAEGLAHDFVGEIVRDSRGFLWFCTGEGLSRFDGYEFKNYTQAHGLPHRSINDLLELEDGTYLVATSDGIAVFNPKGEAANSQANSKSEIRNQKLAESPMFRTFRVPFEMSDQRPFAVSALHKTRAGQIWAATEVGLYRVSREGDNWLLEKTEAEAWRGKYSEMFSIAEDRFGRLWLGMAIGLFVFNPDSGEHFKLPDSTGLSIVEDNQGRIWAGNGSNNEKPGLYLYEVSDPHSPPTLVRHFTTADGLTDNVWINSLLKTLDGRILAGIRNGLSEFLPDARIGEPSFRPLFLTDVVSLGEDAGGNIWVGTGTRGAFKLTRRGFTLYKTKEKPPYGGVTSVFSGGSGNEIFVTSSELDLLRFDGEKFSEIRLPGDKFRNWSRNQLDFRSRIDGDWWIPSFAGLIRFPAVQKFEDLARAKPKKIYTTAAGLVSNGVFNLFEDSRGDVWISAIDGVKDRLMRWERKSEKFYGYTSADGLAEHSTATAFAEDAQRNIWLGFYGGGAARFRNGKFQLFSARTGFPTGYVAAIHVDRGGRVWIATGNSGVVRFDNPAEDEPRYTVLNVGNGLSSNQANCITEDNFGRIYIGTARGINRIEPETGRIKLYTQADGLPGSAIGRCASDAEGNLWFSQKFNLARLKVQPDENPAHPAVFIADLRVNGETVKKLSELGETVVQNLHFDSDQRQMQIDFFALGFSTGETLSYQYKLDNSEWSKPSQQRTINLNLSPGSYRFLVRAVNAEGIASENPALVSFSIARPIWQRWWFLTLAALIISGLIYAFYRYRVKRLLELERVRTRIATDLHDDIGSSLSQIAILSEVVRQKVGNNGNGANEPLNLIADTSREMVDSMSDIVWAINPQKDHLSDLIQRMRRFAEDMLDAKDINYRFVVPETSRNVALGADIRREVYLIFKESINNLVKYSGATEVNLSVQVENNSLVASVTDNGKGFDVEEKLNGNYDGFGGNGLKNMRHRAENLGGVFEIESEIGKGTVARLKIPLDSKIGIGNWKKVFPQWRT